MLNDLEQQSREKPLTAYGIPIWNPLEHGVQNTPLMIPAHEHNRITSNLLEALFIALKYVPLNCEDAQKIHDLKKTVALTPE